MVDWLRIGDKRGGGAHLTFDTEEEARAFCKLVHTQVKRLKEAYDARVTKQLSK